MDHNELMKKARGKLQSALDDIRDAYIDANITDFYDDKKKALKLRLIDEAETHAWKAIQECDAFLGAKGSLREQVVGPAETIMKTKTRTRDFEELKARTFERMNSELRGMMSNITVEDSLRREIRESLKDLWKERHAACKKFNKWFMKLPELEALKKQHMKGNVKKVARYVQQKYMKHIHDDDSFDWTTNEFEAAIEELLK